MRDTFDERTPFKRLYEAERSPTGRMVNNSPAYQQIPREPTHQIVDTQDGNAVRLIGTLAGCLTAAHAWNIGRNNQRFKVVPKEDRLRDEEQGLAYKAELARVRREHMLAADYAELERRVMANDAAYVAALERAYPHLKGEE